MYYSKNILLIFSIILLLLSLFSVFLSSRDRIKILFLQAFMVSIFFGFREKYIGADTHVYVNEYLAQSNWLDIGLTLISKIIYFFFKNNWRMYLFILSFIISMNTALIYKSVFENNNKYICISYWMLFCMPYMTMMQVNIIRQGLAITLFIVSYIYAYIYKKKIGILFTFIACTIHYTVIIIFIVLIIFRKLKLNTIFVIIFSIIFLLMSIGGFIEIVVNFIPSSYVRAKFFSYLNNNKSYIGFFIKYIFYFLGYIYMSLFVNKIDNKSYKFLYDLYGILLLIASFLYTSQLSATRFLLSSDVIIPISYVYSYKFFKEKKLYISIFVLLNSIYYFFSLNSIAFYYTFYI